MISIDVNSGDATLHVRCYGQNDKPTLVLVHGYPDNSDVWLPLLPFLEQDFYVVLYDVRGAGRSSTPTQGDYSLARLSLDLEAVLDAVSPQQPVHLVGHDWGSIQSWESVTDARLQHRIASFTSISGPCLDHMGFWLRNRLRRPTFEGLGQVIRQWLHSWYVMLFHLPGTQLLWPLGLARLWPLWLRRTESVQVERCPGRARDGRHGVGLYRANFIRRLLFPRRRSTNIPVQLLVPQQDPYVTPALFYDLKQWVSQLQLVPIAGGHWQPLSCPEELARHLKRFVLSLTTDGVEESRGRYEVAGSVRRFSGKLVLITGAGGGIGRATALAFAQEGAAIVATDINLDAALRTTQLARLHQVRAWAFKTDVGDSHSMQCLADHLQESIGTPDFVINNAGIGMAGGTLQTRDEDWETVLRVNLWGIILGSRLFGEKMVAAGCQGQLVNVVSAAAFSPSRMFPVYATSKAAALMLSECLRAEYSRHHIGVSAICPGFVDTGIAMATRYVNLDPEQEQRQRRKSSQLYRLRGFPPEKVARVIVAAVIHNRALSLVGIEAHFSHWLSRLSPPASRQFAKLDLFSD